MYNTKISFKMYRMMIWVSLFFWHTQSEACLFQTTNALGFNLGTITADPSVPVGGTLSGIISTSPIGNNVTGCSTTSQGGIVLSSSPVSSVVTPEGRAVFPTGVAGVGFAISVFDQWVLAGTSIWLPYTSAAVASLAPKLYLVKTGDITGGTFPVGSIGRQMTDENGDFLPISITGGSISASGCVVRNPAVNIDLGQWGTSIFTGVGSTAPSWSVNISLECSIGTAISATISATEDPNVSNIIKLSDDSVATGIGVQILDLNQNPLPLNTIFQIEDSTSQEFYDVSWQARFYQVSSTVGAGQANANATVMFTYE